MKIVDIVGARPQFIKITTVLRAIQRYNQAHPENRIQEVLVHTGQHYDYEMSGVFFDELGLKPPDYHLGVGSGTHGYQTGEMIKRVEEVLLAEKPDLVIVYGDTNSTLAGALAAVKLHIPVAHVEAGLRSFNKRMPEEINRILTDHVSDLLFCPTPTAVENLRREGITKGVYLVGDVMYDAVLQYLALAEQKSRILERLGLRPESYAVATVHRAENTDNPNRLRAIFDGLEAVAQAGLPVVLPLHPRTRKQAESLGLSLKGVRVLEPVSYLDMLLLEKNARLIITDSGGVQKEAFFFRVPCVTLREETEWVETVETGWNVLVGCDPKRIRSAALLAQPGAESACPYGDGRAGEKILEALKELHREVRE
ncbi:non-hydrolyzing UDP-N-acetylglucosamine 2-epimerase [Thermoflexus sp.]|uniref:non-hydrolyzing UDP-N-acetylglucosamine 2-epimerase n=1 Tax=Thermoflexus sp. TaxID=1969742 RepID=UPI002ADD434F|nr:UDP-N-acetylglucosamine 2-epimerase (non-hydrolyzing) [Thermoflexus sp.]